MCTNQRLIFPKFLKRPMYIKCGHCKACLQEKAAHRVRRIKDTYSDGLSCFLVTLTYSRGTAPYIFRDDAYEFSNGNLDRLFVWRDCYFRKVRKPTSFDDYNQTNIKHNYVCCLDSIDFVDVSSLKGTKDLKHEFGKIGVVYYKDYQHFIARLRLNLKRHYNYEGPLFVYACSEFGTQSLRPHFHLLIFCLKSAKAQLRNAVFESWPFSDLRRFRRAFEESFRAASYVASYVNQSDKFPQFFKDYFKPKHSYSKGFGINNPNFQLSKILAKLESGYLSYSVLQSKSGIPIYKDVPFPSYVINRFFPKFKGYTRLAPSSLVENLQRIGRFDFDGYNNSVAPLYLSYDEFYKVNVRLMNAYKRFCEYAPDGVDKTFLGYYMLHKRVWDCYNASLLRLHLLNDDLPMLEKYDNLDECLALSKRGIIMSDLDLSKVKETNPNLFHSTMVNTARFVQSFNDHIKHKTVSNAIYVLDVDCEL